MNRSEQVRAAIVVASEGQSMVEAICTTACRLLSAESAAVSFTTASGPVIAVGSDAGAMRLAMAQTVAGDGPLLSGMTGDLPLVVGDLHDAAHRWPVLSDVLASGGDDLGSMIVIPLRIGSARIGVLSVYRRVVGDLDTEQYADAVVLAGAATELLLDEGVGPESDPVAAAASMGSVRVILSVRGIGEGHRSSIGFRTALIDGEARITLEPAAREVLVGRVQPGLVHRGALLALMPRPDDLGDDVRAIIDSLGDRFDQVRLLDALASARVDPFTYRNVTAAIQDCRLIAERSYDVVFDADTDLSQRVLFPRAAAEWGGMEDARFVRFVDDDGSVTHYASYTAFDGRSISGQMLRTDDFCRFSIGPLAGPAAVGKGMALFPRRIGGRFAALVRPDHETLSIAFAEQLSCWPESTPIHVPSAPWELTQSGNAGSPIETDAGWLVLTHSVGPLRTYSLGALLLDRDDPTRVLGTLDEPLISPDDAERDGYVPNVVYSCGPIAVGDNLVIPYGCADQSIGFASVPIDDLIHRMTRSASP